MLYSDIKNKYRNALELARDRLVDMDDGVNNGPAESIEDDYQTTRGLNLV
jgi:hypothetical protein